MSCEPTSGPTEKHAGDHVVRFYENTEFLVETACHFLGQGVRNGESGVVIAREGNLAAMEAKLRGQGLDLDGARSDGRWSAFDASEMLSRFLVGGRPDGARFREAIGPVLSSAASRSRARGGVRAFGEMVAILWADGNGEAAIRLEELWNELARSHAFSLLCAYPMGGFRSQAHGEPFRRICEQHARVLPAETYPALSESEDQLRAIAGLQQKAAALEKEVHRRRKIEKALRLREVQLAESHRRKDEFLAMLGHELRNPLSPIVTAVELARLRRNDTDGVDRALEVIDRQVRQLTRLVDDLVDVSRITRGAIELREEMVQLSSVVERAVEQARRLIEERGHHLKLELPDEPLWFRADPARLAQVLANLLSNAARYTAVGGKIRLFARREEEEIVVTVADNGMGLDPELRERAFDLFVRGRGNEVRTPGGLGVGLTLVRRLVELHGGAVEARSEGPGRGSEFEVRIPLRDPHAGAKNPAGGLFASGFSHPIRRRILVVDDNADAAEGLAEVLAELGHDARTASNGAAAIEEAVRFRPEIIFLDISMPLMNGYEVARRLRQEHLQCVLVALTGYGQEEDRRLAREAGFDHHLVKPLDFARLEALLLEN